MIRKKIAGLIKKSILDLQKKGNFPKFELPEIKIEYPEQTGHGDYSSNIAMRLAKEMRKKPMEIAGSVTESLDQSVTEPIFKKTEIAKPGFINFFITREYLQKQIEEILKKKEKYGQLEVGKGKKVQVEFISANPTGPLTVANARGGPLGNTLGNVLKKAGFTVEKAYYINDYGMQVLTLGHSVLKDEKAQYRGDYIDYLHKKIKGKDPDEVGQKAAQIIIEKWIKKTVKKLGITYNTWDSETSFHKSGAVDKAIEFLEKKGLIYRKEGAVWFKSSQFGDERDRVLVKTDGIKTYLAGDIAYHKYKFEKKKFDKVINIWGADHHGDVPGILAVAEALGHKGKLDIILLQFLTLFEKKKKLRMSKRAGIYVTMSQLLDEVDPSVVKFFFLQRASDTHLNFDLALAKEQSEKNPVYYVQYAHARICSILQKLKIQDSKFKTKARGLKLLIHPSELNLIKRLIKFPEIIEDTARDYQAQRLPQYAIDLATVFHRFYRDCKVVTQEEDLKEARLSLILATKIVLKETLNLMGILALEKM